MTKILRNFRLSDREEIEIYEKFGFKIIEINYNSLTKEGKKILEHPKNIKGCELNTKRKFETAKMDTESKKLELIKRFNIKTYN